jgi:hypothetical protein
MNKFLIARERSLSVHRVYCGTYVVQKSIIFPLLVLSDLNLLAI